VIKQHEQREMVNRIRDRIKARNPTVPQWLRELVAHEVADELALLRKQDIREQKKMAEELEANCNGL